jgi:hypothetical protein
MSVRLNHQKSLENRKPISLIAIQITVVAEMSVCIYYRMLAWNRFRILLYSTICKKIDKVILLYFRSTHPSLEQRY